MIALIIVVTYTATILGLAGILWLNEKLEDRRWRCKLDEQKRVHSRVPR